MKIPEVQDHDTATTVRDDSKVQGSVEEVAVDNYDPDIQEYLKRVRAEKAFKAPKNSFREYIFLPLLFNSNIRYCH